MGETGPIHDLLPWYLTRTLDAAEEEAFRDHLESCPGCREELEVLKKIRDAAEQHGPAFFSEHPPAEQLVAAVRGELDEEAAGEIRRHLALCSTCATESRWVAGELVAGAKDAARPEVVARRPRAWTWALAGAAAASLLIVAVLALGRGPAPGSHTGVTPFHFIAPAERDAGTVKRIPRPPGGRPLVLMLEVDYPAEVLPVRIEISDAGGGTVWTGTAGREDLTDELYVMLVLDAGGFDPGVYTAWVRPSTGDAPPLRSGFEITD